MLLVKKSDYEKIKEIKGVGKCVEKLSHEGEWFSRRENDKIDTEFRKANPKYHYGLGGALIFIGLGVAGLMAYNSSKNQAPEGEYKVKLYKKGTLQDTIIFSESYVDKATQDFKKLGYVVRVAKIKTMAEGGGVGEEVYIEFLNKDKGFKKDVKHFNSYEEAVKWGRENFDNFNSDMIHYKMAKGGGVVTYKNKYNKKYGYDKNESHSLEDIAKDTKISIKGLQQIYDKGIGAYKTNPQSVRPNVKSKEQWAMARVYSSVMGGKASKIDANELKMAKGGGVSVWEKNGFTEYPRTSPQEWNLVEWSFNGHSPSFRGKMYLQKGTDFMFIEKENGELYKPKSSNKLFWREIGKFGKGGGVMENIKQKMSEMNIALNTKTGQVYVGGIKPKNRVFKDEKGYYLVEGYGKFMGKKYPIKKHFTPSENEVLDAYMQDKYAKGGGVKTEFDKIMVLNNLDMIKEYSVAIDKMVTENTKLDEWVKMKLTKVEQNMADIKHAIEGYDKYGEGGQIFKKQLLHISKYATDIKEMVIGDAEVMSWVEGKLFVSADYMDTLYHFLDYESGNTASKYRKGGKLDTEYVVYDWDTYNKLSTHKTIESAKKRMYELYKERKNFHLAVKNRDEFEQTKKMLQMKEGGSIEDSSKVGLHLPMEISVYVPSTKDANIPVSKEELNARVKEVKQYLATLFGGYSSSEILGGYVSTTGELIQEDVVKVISFATKQAYEDNEATLIDKIADWSKEWSQEAIGLEIEGDLYYINQTQETFRVGGSVIGFEYTIGGL